MRSALPTTKRCSSALAALIVCTRTEGKPSECMNQVLVTAETDDEVEMVNTAMRLMQLQRLPFAVHAKFTPYVTIGRVPSMRVNRVLSIFMDLLAKTRRVVWYDPLESIDHKTEGRLVDGLLKTNYPRFDIPSALANYTAFLYTDQPGQTVNEVVPDGTESHPDFQRKWPNLIINPTNMVPRDLGATSTLGTKGDWVVFALNKGYLAAMPQDTRTKGKTDYVVLGCTDEGSVSKFFEGIQAAVTTDNEDLHILSRSGDKLYVQNGREAAELREVIHNKEFLPLPLAKVSELLGQLNQLAREKLKPLELDFQPPAAA